MKTTLLELKSLIRSLLIEAPLADVLPFIDVSGRRLPREKIHVVPDDDENNNLEDLERGSTSSPEEIYDRNSKQVEKFVSGKKFRDDSVRLYRNLTVPIYIIPAYDSSRENGDVRAWQTDRDELKNLNLSSEKMSELAAALEQGATVWVCKSSSLQKGFLPTPWMIVHSMFDQNDGDEELQELTKFFVDLDKLEQRLYRDPILKKRTMNAFGLTDRPANAYDLYHNTLTMKSARERQISSSNDAAAEILCQAILTSKGFVFNHQGIPEIDDVFSKIASETRDSRQRFEAYVSGKIINIDVFQSDEFSD